MNDEPAEPEWTPEKDNMPEKFFKKATEVLESLSKSVPSTPAMPPQNLEDILIRRIANGWLVQYHEHDNLLRIEAFYPSAGAVSQAVCKILDARAKP